MTRKTSIHAWESIQSTLPASRARVLEVVIRHPDMTGREIESRLAGQRLSRKSNARLSELAQQGMVRESGIRECSITGRPVVTWRWTGRKTPLPLPKKRELKQLLAEEVMDLKQRVQLLERSHGVYGGIQ